ncbi:MAG: hypothetical protein AAF386_09525, partial [Pseudomonadota bacterium]
TDPYSLMTLMHKLKPKFIFIDSEFMMEKAPTVHFFRNETDNPLNALERVPGQDVALVGTPTRRWVWAAADTLGYQVEWVDWTKLPVGQRGGVRDYFRQGAKRRGTVALRPKDVA